MYETSAASKYAPASTAPIDDRRCDVGSSEYWKDIEGFPNYQVSNHGRVKNNRTGKILKPYQTKKGYLTVGFWLNGKKKRLSIHRLVAQAFLPNSNNLPEVNHINGCKADNHLCNLEWVSCSANVSHAYQNGLRQAKLSNSDKEKILQLINQGLTQRTVGKLFNVSHSTIGNIERSEL
ncbi:MAG: NUMOD4 domain-containing protein [Cyanobacteria bacterium P01_G01_bin.67]